MGSVVSAVFDALKGIKAALSLLSALSTEFNAALNRAAKLPGLPNPKPTQPYWLNNPPFPELVDIGSPRLPETADVAVIGSGIAGAAIVRSLLHERRRRGTVSGSESGLPGDGKIVVFEARQLCSGATARNGGHIKPTAYEIFPRFRNMYGPERAAALTRFQLRHIDCLTELCASEGIDAAEAREVETADLYLDEETFRKTVEDLAELKEWVPEVNVEVWESDEARKKFGANESVAGALSYRAGAIWAYRFAVSIWKRLLDDFPEQLFVETMTPVEAISTSPDELADFPYIVHTPRGTVHVRHVVHATNAFASHLVPGLRSKITGVRAHMSSQRPGDLFPNCQGQRSWGVIYGGAFDYVTQRPSSPDEPQGDLMLGGGFSRSLKQGVDQVGLYDDGARIDALTVSHISGIFPAVFSPKWGEGASVENAWSGILGMTGDFLPFVGRLHSGLTGRKVASKKVRGLHGEWIAAGFSGEGMVWAWLSGTALGIMVDGCEEEELAAAPGRPKGKTVEWLPRELMVSSARMRSADISNLAS
ncbi:hypothetical protein BN1708_003057 [Verticillium longisporum]|nr:hypothetical protein HYQ44_014863 [Verticillium longisporum]CRK17779.1 hypothetical protein BN1708_003057 [Verticillium longisporum]